MKRSVYKHNTQTKPPYYFLKLSKFAYDNAPIKTEKCQLMYASTMSAIYLGALRVSEAVGEKGIKRSQVLFDVTNSEKDVVLISNLVTEKTEGRIREVPIPKNDPIAAPLLAYMEAIQDPNQLLFDMTRFTPLNIVKRFTGSEGWTHWLRSQRVSWVSSYLYPYELDAFGGWGKEKPKNPRDFYIHRQWRDYADKIVAASEHYWATAQIDDELKVWLSLLG